MESLIAILVVVVPALITGMVSIIVCLITTSVNRKKDDAEQDKRITELENRLQIKLLELSAAYQQSVALITEKIAELDKKQSIHNGVIERVFNLEKKTEVHEEKIKVANNRIADLERK